MSGGRWEYIQYRLVDMQRDVEIMLERQGKPMPQEYAWTENQTYETFTPEMVKSLERTILLLKLTYIHLQRADWYLSGDDGEETYIKRLKDDLKTEKLLKMAEGIDLTK